MPVAFLTQRIEAGRARLAAGPLRLPAGLVAFLGVGVVGLLTDLSILWTLEHAGLPMWAARAVSLTVATLVTWALNRRHTFASSGRSAHHEALRYAGVALVAQSVNYLAGLSLAAALPHLPHTACAFAGAVVATLFSYTGQRFFTFARA